MAPAEGAPPHLRLEGIVALVTGASSGIGRAIALEYARQGCALVACADLKPDCPDPDETDDETPTHEVIQARFGKDKAVFLACDVRVEERADKAAADVPMGLAEVIDEVAKAKGRLDVLVNNAGVYEESVLHETSQELWKNVMATNAGGCFLGSKHAVKQFLEQDPDVNGCRGSIINISSVGAFVGILHGAPYCASKAAIAGITRTTALEYGEQDIRSNALCPGFIDTPMISRFLDEEPKVEEYLLGSIPNRRLGLPSNLAGAAVWLAATSESSYVNGVAIPIDGGFVTR